MLDFISMNFGYWARKISGRATCILGKGSKLALSARIRNIRGRESSITVGQHCFIAGELLTFAHGGDISIGDWCFVGRDARIWSAGKIQIGDRVLISHNVNIFDSLTHPLDAAQRHEHFRETMLRGHPREIDLGELPVRIENDVWIGANSCVLRGVTIGAGAIVGAASVVAHHVPPGALVVGNPAKVLKIVSDKKAAAANV